MSALHKTQRVLCAVEVLLYVAGLSHDVALEADHDISRSPAPRNIVVAVLLALQTVNPGHFRHR